MLLSIYVHITMLIIISIIGFFFFYRFEHYMPPPHNTINRAWHFSFFITHRGYLTMLKYFACYQFNLPMFCCRNFIVHNFLFMCALNFDLQNFLKNFCLHCARLIEQSCAVTFASCPITIVLILWSVRCSTRFVLWPAGAYGPGQEERQIAEQRNGEWLKTTSWKFIVIRWISDVLGETIDPRHQ